MKTKAVSRAELIHSRIKAAWIMHGGYEVAAEHMEKSNRRPPAVR